MRRTLKVFYFYAALRLAGRALLLHSRRMQTRRALSLALELLAALRER